MNIFIGNAISLIASIIMVLGNGVSSKQKTIIWQTIQTFLTMISCIILNAYSGAITAGLSIPRNILIYKEKFILPVKIPLWLLIISLSLYFNTNGIIGYLPLIAVTAFIFFADKVKDAGFKWLMIFTLVLWGIHDLYVKNYVKFIFDVLSIFTSLIAIYHIYKANENKETSENNYERNDANEK